MKKTTLLLAVLALCAGAWAADNAEVGTRPTASHQSPIANPQALDAITIPQMLSYQGKLTDTFGLPVADTTYSVNFRLYPVPSGGSSFWNETQTVRTHEGLFSTLLGSVAQIESVPSAGSLYLGMQVESGGELSPRLRIVGSAYSYLAGKSANADLLQGKDTTGFVRAGQANSVTSAMIVNGTVAAADLNQMGASSGQVMKWTGSTWAPRNDSVGGGGDNAWVRGSPDSVLFTVRKLGIARGGAGNVLYGESAYTHVNLGVACTTGMNAQSYSYATVGGGRDNAATGMWSFVGGGSGNVASGLGSVVSGGTDGNAFGQGAFVGGGIGNDAPGLYATAVGGDNNKADSNYTTVGGGRYNYARGRYGTIDGGYSNYASGEYGWIGGGCANQARGEAAMVPGGRYNFARGRNSFAAGCFACANHQGSFVWSDEAAGIAETLYTSGSDQFRVRARGGTWFFSNAAMTTGAYLAPGSNSWESACDSATKEDFRPVDRREVLEKVASLRVRNYKMKDQDDGTRHIGPVAQDFHTAFAVGENNTSINMADADGVLFAAVQALYQDNRQLRQELEALKAELQSRQEGR